MADETYEVLARLRLEKADKAGREARRVAAEVRKIKGELRESQRQSYQTFATVSAGFSRMGRTATAISRTIGRVGIGLGALGAGVAYLGLRRASTLLQDVSRYAISANRDVENTVLSVASLSTEIERISFGQATTMARGLYQQMEQLAISSPGTARDIADVFTLAYGPMRRAGVEMNRLLNFSRDAVAVASALRIDLPQVARDIGQMATGAAGQDVRTFRSLRAMGLITETTQQWNQMAQRTPEVAARRMTAIFQRLGQRSAEAFGNTWTGLASAFQDIMGFFARAATSPAFEVLKRELKSINQFLLAHRVGIQRVLSVYGARFAGVMTRVFERVRQIFYYAWANFGYLQGRFHDIVTQVRQALPTVLRIAQVTGGLMVALRLAGGALSAIGGVGTVLSGLGMMGLGGGGAAAATAAGGTAAAGGAGLLGGGIAASLSTIAAAAAPLAAVFAGIAAAGVAVWRAVTNFGSWFRTLLAPVADDFRAIGSDLMVFFRGAWDFLDPIITYAGTVIVSSLILGLRTALPVIRSITTVLRLFGRALSWAGNTIIRPTFNALSLVVISTTGALSSFGDMIRGLNSWMRRTLGITPEAAVITGPNLERGPGRPMTSPYSIVPRERPRVAPSERPQTTVDMRGSRIEVRQEFREADPDRVWIQLRDGLSREAVQRVSSPFVPALTR